MIDGGTSDLIEMSKFNGSSMAVSGIIDVLTYELVLCEMSCHIVRHGDTVSRNRWMGFAFASDATASG
jgi:hypothetical protein